MTFLTIRETAATLQLCYDHTRKLVNRGEIPSVKIGKRRRVRPSDLEILPRRTPPLRLRIK